MIIWRLCNQKYYQEVLSSITTGDPSGMENGAS